jgi:integrase
MADPLEERDASRAIAGAARTKLVTFADAAESFLQMHEDSWRNRAHRQQWRATLRDYVLPELGAMDVKVIDAADVLEVLKPIWNTKGETAERVRARIERVLDFAGRNGEDNPAKWSGNLEHKLPKREKKKTRVKHLGALPYDDIPAFMAELRKIETVAARALEIITLIGVRTNELLQATWSEINVEQNLWHMPREHLKRPAEEEDGSHTIPLAPAVIKALSRVQEMLGMNIMPNDLIFPIGEKAMLTLMHELRPEVTVKGKCIRPSVHGQRAAFRSWAGGCTAHPRDVCEMALGHTVGDETERTYQRDQLLAKRRVLMADWSDYCCRPPADLIPLKASA